MKYEDFIAVLPARTAVFYRNSMAVVISSPEKAAEVLRVIGGAFDGKPFSMS